MGCCSSNDKNIEDFPFQKIEEYNALKSEIDEIISDKGHKERKNPTKLFELFNKTSTKITEFEKEVKSLKNKKIRNPNIGDDMIKGLNNDIKQLKQYNHTLNDLIKESDDNDINNNDKDKYKDNIINTDNYERKTENEIRNDFQNEIINEEINMSNNDMPNNNNE